MSLSYLLPKIFLRTVSTINDGDSYFKQCQVLILWAERGQSQGNERSSQEESDLWLLEKRWELVSSAVGLLLAFISNPGWVSETLTYAVSGVRIGIIVRKLPRWREICGWVKLAPLVRLKKWLLPRRLIVSGFAVPTMCDWTI